MKNKTLIIGSGIIAIMVLLLGFSSCKKGWWGNEESGGNGNNGVIKEIGASGVVYYQNCGVSVFGTGLWIKLNDGTLLQPCNELSTVPTQMKEGDQVELIYSKFSGVYPSFEINCTIPPIVFTKANIVFIKKVGNILPCSPVVLTDNYTNINQAKAKILEAKIEGTYLKMRISYAACGHNTTRFSLVAQMTAVNAIPTYEVKLADSWPETEMCVSPLEDDLCIDISSLKLPISSSYVKIKLLGFEKELMF